MLFGFPQFPRYLVTNSKINLVLKFMVKMVTATIPCENKTYNKNMWLKVNFRYVNMEHRQNIALPGAREPWTRIL